ncbi:Ig-like domain-containing protein [Corallococcus sp. CA047B]|uniref:RCC1 domain-containing protein n=1 Tax=Corallococcus sp. CA047B TaxID=2316729 RepID=UPI0011C42E87|nr:kelch-like protein [Corallococcus sp. CA047B]
MSQERRSRLFCLAVGLMVALAGCVSEDASGSAQVVVTLPQGLSASDVVRVELTVSGEGMTARTDALVKTGAQWGGVLGKLPEGEGRTFHGEAFDAQGARRYEGEATGVRIFTGETTAVALVLQEVNAPAPFENTAPVITSLVASPSTVGPEGVVALQASAEDSDAEDDLTYAWTASAGSFSSPGSLTTTWVAPSVPGAVVLTLTVTDSKGASDAVSLSITVTSGTGSVAVNVTVNTWPRVTGVTAMPSSVAVGQATSVTAVAGDADGDSLGYQWTSDCQGTWTDETSPNASFTPTAQPPMGSACARCSLRVTVADGRGGQTTGTLGVCVGPSTQARFPPEVVETFQSVVSVPAEGGTVVFRVRAKDPQDSALTFAWATNVGALGAASSGGVTSEVLWTAPSCIPEGTTPAVTVSVTNALGLSSSASFGLQGGTVCTAPSGRVIRIAGSYYSTMALKQDGTVWTWGRNNFGNLGDGTTVNRDTPVQVQGLTGVTAIAPGDTHMLALKQDGSVWAWGDNGAYELGDGTTVPRPTAGPVPGLTDVVAIASGGYHSLALKQDGTVWAWGWNIDGSLGDGSKAARAVPVQVLGLTGVVTLRAGWHHMMAVKQDGTVWGWGLNSRGQLGDGTTAERLTPVQVQGLTDVAAIVPAAYHTLALKQDGTVWAWGYNDYGQLGNGTTTSSSSPVQVPGLTGVVALAGGRYHSLALKQDGTVWAWGWNHRGQFGDGTTTHRGVPGRVPGLTGVSALTAGQQSTFALKQDGTVWAWGDNGWGALGAGPSTDQHSPVQVHVLGH